QALAVIRARSDPPGPADIEDILDRARRRAQAPPPAPAPVPGPSIPPRPAPDMRRVDRCLFAAGAFLLAVYFFRLTRASLHVYFTPDDLMNLYRSWIYSAGLLIKAN